MNRSLLLARCITKIAESAVATLVLWTFVPMLLGWSPVVITSGSMEPGVRPGDIVVIEPVDATATPLDVGDVATYRQPGSGRRVTHRIASVDDNGTYTTKGDANQRADSDPLPADHVEGKARVLVPYAGMAATSPAARVVATVAVLAIAARRLRRRPTTPPVVRETPDAPPIATPAAAPVVAWTAPAATSAPTVAVAVGQAVLVAPAAPTGMGEPWTAGVRERRTTVRRRRLVGAGAVMVLVAVIVPVAAVAAFTGGIDNGATFDADVVQPPTGMTATAGCDTGTGTVTVGWTASTSVPVDGYDVLRSDGGGAYQHLATVGPSDTSVVDGPVAAGDYAYVARTLSGTWTSSDSTAATVTVAACA